MAYEPKIDYGGMSMLALPRPITRWEESETWSEDVVEIPLGETVVLDRKHTGWVIEIEGTIVGEGATLEDQLANLDTVKSNLTAALEGRVSGSSKYMFDLYFWDDSYFTKCKVDSFRISRTIRGPVPIMPWSMRVRSLTKVISGGEGEVATNFTSFPWRFDGATVVSTLTTEVPIVNYTGRDLAVRANQLHGVSAPGSSQSTWVIADYPVGGSGTAAPLVVAASSRNGSADELDIQWLAGETIYVRCTQAGGHEDAFGSILAEG
jgi:hypothetical protein